MRRVIIDALDMPDRDAMHLVLKDALNLPPYYGHNLDALWDCLMEIKPVELYLRHPGLLRDLPNDLGEKLIVLLEKAAKVHPGFAFRRVGK